MKHCLIDGQGNDISQLLGDTQESDSLRRLIKIVFHKNDAQELEETISSEVYNLMNGVDLSIRKIETELLVRNLIFVQKFHQEKLIFINTENYDKQNENHESQLMQLWRTLKPGREISNRVSKEWIEIGF